MSAVELWEILVPTVRTVDGKPIKTRYHRVWDKMVYNIAGGCTILEPTKGKWVAPGGELFEERMIPVRIACTKEQIDIIVDLTLEYYDQKAIIAYKVSNEVILRHRSDHGKIRIIEKIGEISQAMEKSHGLDDTDGNICGNEGVLEG